MPVVFRRDNRTVHSLQELMRNDSLRKIAERVIASEIQDKKASALWIVVLSRNLRYFPQVGPVRLMTRLQCPDNLAASRKPSRFRRRIFALCACNSAMLAQRADGMQQCLVPPPLMLPNPRLAVNRSCIHECSPLRLGRRTAQLQSPAHIVSTWAGKKRVFRYKNYYPNR